MPKKRLITGMVRFLEMSDVTRNALGHEVQSHYSLWNVVLAGRSASISIWTNFACQCIKLVGKRQLDAAFQHELTFAIRMHQFNAGQAIFGGPK